MTAAEASRPGSPSRIAFVAPWFGESIPGGAESLTRMLARLLRDHGWPVEVLTTCVRDFRSDWSEDFHVPGTTLESGLVVRRFPVRPRNRAQFDRVNARLLRGETLTASEERTFLDEMIHSPDLYGFMSRHQQRYAYLLIPYMFGTTYAGTLAAPSRSVLIPCFHDESYARLAGYRRMVEEARGLIFNSPAEHAFAEGLFGELGDRAAVVGAPVRTDAIPDADRFERRYGLRGFLLYAGRGDAGKNLDFLLRCFSSYRNARPDAPPLVIIGTRDVAVPRALRSHVRVLGYVAPEDVWDAYAASLAVCVPGTLESFSLVMMEAWAAGRPALVNSRCAVKRDFAERSGAGLLFDGADGFQQILDHLRRDPRAAADLGSLGREFVRRSFAPQLVAHRLIDALRRWKLVDSCVGAEGGEA